MKKDDPDYRHSCKQERMITWLLSARRILINNLIYRFGHSRNQVQGPYGNTWSNKTQPCQSVFKSYR